MPSITKNPNILVENYLLYTILIKISLYLGKDLGWELLILWYLYFGKDKKN